MVRQASIGAALVVAVVLGLALASSCEPPASPPPDAGVDASVDAGRCGVCPAERPHCDEAEGLCVECDDPEHCTGELRACVNGRCVECVTNRDCPSAALPHCYIGTHTCRACTSDDACLFRPGTPRCVAGACVP